jgi:MerR family transcriptional regulator, thiopeptide resistance regulator
MPTPLATRGGGRRPIPRSEHPGINTVISPKRFLGYGEMYVADERFAANYGGASGARFVRDAIEAFVASVRD